MKAFMIAQVAPAPKSEKKYDVVKHWITWIISFMSALSVDILAFFITETDGPTHVTKMNFARLLISSPV